MRAVIFIFLVIFARLTFGAEPPKLSPDISPRETRSWTNSPIEAFRHLLALSPVEREKALLEKPAPVREFLATRLAEYDALTPEERELRLRLSQLRYYLHPLLRPGLTNRAERVAAIPTEDRKFVEVRLKLWDSLTPELRQEVLENEWLTHAVLRYESSSPAQQKQMLAAMPPAQRQRLEADLANWHALPPEKQQRMVKNFNQFFELNDKEKSKILDTLPLQQRQQMERIIATFEKLPTEQRAICMKSLERFATMTPQQQMEFLSNAERWAKLSDAEKAAMRKLVVQFPPLPPGLEMPPLPPGLAELPPLPGATNNR